MSRWYSCRLRILASFQQFSRRDLASLVALAVAFGAPWPALAEEVAVPVRAQVELLAKVATYDRNFRARAGHEARVLVVIKASDAESERLASALSQELGALPSIAGLPPRPSTLRYTTPQALAAEVRARQAAIVYLSTGLGDQMPAIATALVGVDVLSAAVSASYAAVGSVLAFELSSGRPKLLIHLAQAKRQNVAFTPELLRLAKVIQ